MTPERVRRSTACVLTKGEQETIIRWDQADRVAYLHTSYQPDARRWQRAGIDVERRAGSWWAEVPASWVRIRPPRRKTGGKAFQRAIITVGDCETTAI